MFFRRFFPCVAALLFVVSGARAQGPASEYVRWSTALSTTSASAGELVTLRLAATIAAPWKMYAIGSPSPSYGLRFVLASPAVALEGDLRQREPARLFDEAFKSEVLVVKEHTFLEADLRVAPDASAGATEVKGTVTFVICNDESLVCLPPYRAAFSAPLTILAPAGASVTAVPSPVAEAPAEALAEAPAETTTPTFRPAVPAPTSAPPVEVSATPTTVGRGGFWAFVVLAIGAGLGALLMPCVFPMIPLTVSYFTKHAHDRSQAVRMALVYGLAIVGLFTGLGLLMAWLLGASGAQTIAANPWINLFIGVVFVAFALSLLGLYEMRLPTSLLNFVNRQSNERQGYAGVLFMGTTLTLVSFSCTAPFVGTLLAATTVGQWSYPALGMVIFSATFALPFVLFALFPRGLSRLPAAGSWMNTLKVVFGFIELAAALKFLSNADLVWGWNLLSRPLAIALTSVILFLAGLYLIGKIRLETDEADQPIGAGRLVTAVAFFGVALYLIPGLFGAPLNRVDAFLPPRKGTDVSLLASFARTEAALDEGWFEEIEPAYAEARELGKPVFIDFTGYTCTNCRQMEANVFPHPDVAGRFADDFVLLRLYTDDLDAGPDLQRFQLDLTGTVALPTYAIVDPNTSRLLDRISGVVSVDRFVAFLSEGAARYRG